MKEILPKKILFIKLGASGSFEKECIDNNIVKLSYDTVDHELCIAGDWNKVREYFMKIEKSNKQVASSHTNQIKYFYEESNSTLWITFYQAKLWYCFADTEIKLNDDGTKERKVIGRWRCDDINGNTLFTQALSGRFTKVQGFRGTICNVQEADYLLHKINNTSSNELKLVEKNIAELKKSLIDLIKKLNPKDFEIFVDLIFRASGWSRVGLLGKTIKDIDIELLAPVTNERAVVQIKSQSDKEKYENFKKRLIDFKEYDKIFFVTHSPDKKFEEYIKHNSDDIIIYDANRLSELSINAGLIEWLISIAI